MVDGLAAQMGHAFPELVKQLAFIRQIIEQEEKGFIQKLERGSRMFEEYVRERSNQPNNTAQIVDGNFAFELYDTFGFPLDLTELMARERGWKVDTQTFAQNMAAQRERARAATQVQAGDWVELYPQANPIFVGYDKSETSTRIVRYRTVSSKKGNAYHIVLEETPFYAESGGQVGDTGYLFNGEERIQVLDTVRENDLIIHITDALPSNADDVWTATIDMRRRRSIRANHSATHLLQAALQKVLGSHIEQRGSLVNDEYLRFDFSHFQKLSEDEIEKIETLVNDRIADALDREEFREMPIEEAKRMGAMALFGEKYGEKVRVIRFGDGFSTELCGGTHVDNTQEIRIFKIVSESSIAAGIRRIEAVTGTAALAFFDAQIKTLEHIKAALKNPQNVEKALLDVLERNKQLEAQLEKFRTHRLVELRNTLSQEAQQTAKGIKLICQKVTLDSAEEVKSLSFELRKMHSKTAIILGGIFDAKPHLSVMFTDDIADQYNAVEIIRKSAQHIKGGGGGQPFYATAGGKEPEGLDAALAEAQKLLN
jgi:alanyl-tRNA synthetase